MYVEYNSKKLNTYIISPKTTNGAIFIFFSKRTSKTTSTFYCCICRLKAIKASEIRKRFPLRNWNWIEKRMEIKTLLHILRNIIILYSVFDIIPKYFLHITSSRTQHSHYQGKKRNSGENAALEPLTIPF